MGMFDELKCEYPLPIPEVQDVIFQTKDTPNQMLDLFVIKADGSLWVEDYDIENHSKAALWLKDHPGEELPDELNNFIDQCAGSMARVNKREVRSSFNGSINFYEIYHNKWYEFQALFRDGLLVGDIIIITDGKRM